MRHDGIDLRRFHPGRWWPLLLAAALAACGGGGGGDPAGGGTPPPAAADAVVGGWAGTSEQSLSVQAVVLSDGTLWSVRSDGAQRPASLVSGALQAANGQLSADALRWFDFAVLSAVDATAAGTYTAGVRMDYTVTASGAAGGSAVALLPAAGYDPGGTPALADVVGAWGGAYTPNETGAVAIASDGRIDTVTSAGCSSSGTVSPATSGDNVFDVTLTLGPAPCRAPGAAASGIAFVIGSGASARLLFAVMTADRNSAAAFSGTR